MKSYDLDAFEQFMGELAQLYDRQPYSAAPLKQWAEALKEFDWMQVRAHLCAWRDSKGKAPTIGDILPELQRIAQTERERVRQTSKVVELPRGVTPAGIAALAKIHALLRSPVKPSRAWAHELRDRQRAGGTLYFVQEEMAKKVCGADWYTDKPCREAPAMPDRIPGEDDQ